MAEPAHVLDERGDLAGTAEEDEGLVDEVRAEIVDEAIGGGGEVLPRALERRSVAVEAAAGGGVSA